MRKMRKIIKTRTGENNEENNKMLKNIRELSAHLMIVTYTRK